MSGITRSQPGFATGPIICTSGTRPSSPSEGWAIYETDTFKHLIYYNPPGAAGLDWYPPWNVAWGQVVTPIARTTAQTLVSAEVDATGVSLVIPAIAGRRYELCSQARMTATNSGVVQQLIITDSANTHIDECSYATPAVNMTMLMHLTVDIAPVASGNVTYKVRLACIGGGTSDTIVGATRPFRFSAKDIGPA